MWREARAAILQVQDALKIDLRDVVIVEEAICRGGDGEQDGRCGEKQEGAQVCLDGCSRGQESNWCKG